MVTSELTEDEPSTGMRAMSCDLIDVGVATGRSRPGRRWWQ